MVQIKFNQDHFDSFIKEISVPLEEWLIKKEKSLWKEEKSLLTFIKNDIGVEVIIKATPNDFDLPNSIPLDNVIQQVSDEIKRLKNSISKEISIVNFKKYINTLTNKDLKSIAEKHSITLPKKIDTQILLKCLLDVPLKSFGEKSRKELSQKFFLKRVKDILNSIFVKFYNDKWDKIPIYGRYEFVETMELNSCPYCNRNYIFVVEEKKLRPEIDHFYPKSRYPFLAMSYFNLIPSCPACNRTKSDKFTTAMVNPYSTINEENEITFTINLENIDFIQVKKEKYNFKTFTINVRDTKNDNVNKFGIKELYSQHKDTVLDLLVKQRYYPEQYIYFLRTFGFSEDEIYRYLFNNYSEDSDLHKRPLSKLIRDIAKELKLVK